MNIKQISVEEFDRLFDDGEDISGYIDWSKGERAGMNPRHVDFDLPDWLVHSLDAQARQHGTTRQALVEAWLTERVKQGQGLSKAD